MSKQPGSAAATPDSNIGLYASLLSVHAFAEGTGTQTTDAKGSATGTLASSGLWSADADGPLILNTSATVDAITLGSLVQPGDGGSDWSIAFRAKQTANDDNGSVCSDQNIGSASIIWLRGGTGIFIRGVNGFSHTFTGVTVFTAQHDYVITYTKAESTGTLRVYVDGVITSDGGQTWGNSGESFAFQELMSDYSIGLVGTLSYFVSWKGRVLTAAEALTISANPYAILAHRAGFTGGYRRGAVSDGMGRSESWT